MFVCLRVHVHVHLCVVDREGNSKNSSSQRTSKKTKTMNIHSEQKLVPTWFHIYVLIFKNEVRIFKMMVPNNFPLTFPAIAVFSFFCWRVLKKTAIAEKRE